jgi:glucose-6-phosphate 1-dehydrogenase
VRVCIFAADTQELAATVQEIAKTSEDLARVAEGLRALVQGFKHGGGLQRAEWTGLLEAFPMIDQPSLTAAQGKTTQIVIFGASGDLTARKLVPALVNLARQGRPSAGFSLYGVARRPKTDEQFRQELREALSPSDLEAMAAVASRIHYVQGDVEKTEDLRALSLRLDEEAAGQECGRLFYLSLKPELFVAAVENLATTGLLTRSKPWTRVIVEKPFGHDLASARAIN